MDILKETQTKVEQIKTLLDPFQNYRLGFELFLTKAGGYCRDQAGYFQSQHSPPPQKKGGWGKMSSMCCGNPRNSLEHLSVLLNKRINWQSFFRRVSVRVKDKCKNHPFATRGRKTHHLYFRDKNHSYPYCEDATLEEC